MTKNFIDYSHENIHFQDDKVPVILENLLHKLKLNNTKLNICDLGCGDGSMLFSLYQKGLLKNANNIIVGVDLSSERIKRVEELRIKGLKGIVSDACHVENIDENTFDVIINTQVIEHVENDKILLDEIARLPKPNSYLYISSIIKKGYGFWIYRSGGKFVLDPTHVHEYSSKGEFINLLKSRNLYPMQVKITPCRFSIINGLVRLFIKLKFIPVSNQDIFLKHKFLNKLRIFKMPVPGYGYIESICVNKKEIE